MKSPLLDNEDGIRQSANLTWDFPEDYGSGTLVLAGVQAPYDWLVVLVNGTRPNPITTDNPIRTPITAWTKFSYSLDSGAHTVDFVYTFNPFNLTAEELGSVPDRAPVYIDDVIYSPDSSQPTEFESVLV